MITDNILVTFEICHAMATDNNVNGSMALKLDIAKAYDQVEWPFLSRIIIRLGF